MKLVQDLSSDRYSSIDVESSGYITIHVWSTINQFQALPVAKELTIHTQYQRRTSGKFLGEKFRNL
jgi:hypothetical protein